jgi:hypothetical protein
MANTFRGYAQIAGVSGVFTAPAAFYPLKESMKFSHAFEEDIIKDEQGNDAAWRAYNEKYEGDIGMRLVVTAPGAQTTVAAAALAAQLTPYQIVTISGCAIAAWNTSYQVVSGSDIGLTNTTAGSMSWKLRRYADSAQNVLATTAFVP